MSPLILCLFSWNIFAATPVQERMILPKNSILFFFWCVTPKTFFRTVFFFFFGTKKTTSFPPKRFQVSILPTVAFSVSSKALENMVPWASKFSAMRWCGYIWYGMAFSYSSDTVHIWSILRDTSHLCFFVESEVWYARSAFRLILVGHVMVCFVPWTRNLWISKRSIPLFTSYFFSTYIQVARQQMKPSNLKEIEMLAWNFWISPDWDARNALGDAAISILIGWLEHD